MAIDPADANAIWFYAREGATHGPVTDAYIRQLVTLGQLSRTDQVWKQGLPGWVEVAVVPELCPPTGFGVPPPPIPAPPPMPQGIQGAPQPIGDDPFADQPPPAPAVDFNALWETVQLHTQRAFQWNVQQVKLTENEKTQLTAQGITTTPLQRYLAWRRSLFLVVAAMSVFGLLFNLINTENDFKSLSTFGILVQLIRLLTLFALPVASIIAAINWAKPHVSRQVMLGGWLASFFVPIIIAFIPVSWLIDLDKVGSGKERELSLFFAGAILGIAYYFQLMPTVLSLIPGVLRACVRLKSLLPESIVPGWFLVAAAPLYVLIMAVVFVLIFQIASNFFLMLSLAALLGAPLVYVLYAQWFVRPLTSEADKQNIHQVQFVYNCMTGAGIALLILYLFTKELFDKNLMGFDESSSYFRPWRLIPYLLEFTAKSLFVTALASDFLLLMNLSIRRNIKALEQSGRGQKYEALMDELEKTLEPPKAPFTPSVSMPLAPTPTSPRPMPLDAPPSLLVTPAEQPNLGIAAPPTEPVQTPPPMPPMPPTMPDDLSLPAPPEDKPT